MEQQAIPAFYCCYLLRSTVSHRSLYVGSTPNPRRRLSQHNGESKGGARRTSRESLRPWEMTCIVTGFPSSIAALQFEWAWQNPHLSLKIPSAQRVATSTYRTRSGRTKHARPSPSLTGKLEHLHLLLRVDAFSRWPLSVRFFVRDAYEAWKLWCERESTTLRESIKIAFDQRLGESGDETEKVSPPPPPPPPPRKAKWSAHGEGGVQGLDITYDYLDRHLQKSRDILRPGVGLECGLCHDSLEDHTFTLVCPHAFCEHVAHMTCLAREFLRQESSPGDECQIPVLPTHGKCPGCKNKTEWVELVKELSIRTRSKPKKIAAKRKATKKDAEYDDTEDDDDDDDITAADLAEIPQGREGEQVVWGDHDTDMDSAFSDTGSERGDKSRKRKGNPKVGKRLPAVIEDVSSDPGSETGSVRSGSKTAKRKGKAPAKKELPVVIEDSEIGSDLSISGSETRRAKSRSKSRKEKGLAQAKEKMIQVVIEDSDVESNLSNSGTETETVTGGGKLKKRRVGTGLRGKKTLPVVIEDSDIDSDLDKS